VGRTLGNYELKRVLGKGGMGTVYLGENSLIGSRVAIKILHPRYCRDEMIVGRFFAEARAANLIGHENIVRIFDLNVTQEGQYYYVMEHLDGATLGDLIGPGHAPLDRIAPLMYQVLDALGAAHEHGVVHRDLKLANIFITQGADRLVVKVLDFGIAKLHATETDVQTQTGAILGTPHFMAPEQAGGVAVDHRADIYSVGVLLYRVATGRLPFDSKSIAKLLIAQINQTPTSPRALNPAVSPTFDAVILKALEKDPRKRFQTAQEMRHALELVLAGEEPVPIRPLYVAPPAPGDSGPKILGLGETPALSGLLSTPSSLTPAQTGFAVSPGKPLELLSSRPVFPARKHGREKATLELEVRIGDPSGFRRMYTSDISHRGMFIVATGELPPLFTVVEIVLSAGRRIMLTGRVVRVVTEEDAQRLGLQPGRGNELLDLDDAKRAQMEALARGSPATPSGGTMMSRAPEPNVAAARAIEVWSKPRGGHYDVLGVKPQADLDLIRDAVRKIRRETDAEKLGPMTTEQSEQLSEIRRRVEQAINVLGNPRARAEYDGTIKNYLGVAQALASGLRADELKELHQRFVKVRKDIEPIVRGAIREAMLAQYQGRIQDAKVCLERALEADPLNLDLHHRYWAIRRISEPTSPPA
jgi:serine/threonine-protein kinase